MKAEAAAARAASEAAALALGQPALAADVLPGPSDTVVQPGNPCQMSKAWRGLIKKGCSFWLQFWLQQQLEQRCCVSKQVLQADFGQCCRLSSTCNHDMTVEWHLMCCQCVARQLKAELPAVEPP